MHMVSQAADPAVLWYRTLIPENLLGNDVVQSVYSLPCVFIQTVCNQSSFILQALYLRPRDKDDADVAITTASAFRQVACDTPNELVIIKTFRCDIIKEVTTYPSVIVHFCSSALFI